MSKNIFDLHADAIVGPFDASAIGGLATSAVCADDVTQVRLRFRAANEKNWSFVLNKPSQAYIERSLANFAKTMKVSTAEEAVEALDRHFRAAFSDKDQLDDYNQHDFTLEDVELIAGSRVYHSRNGLLEAALDFQRQASFTHTHDPEIGPNSQWHTHPTAVRVLLDSADTKSIETLRAHTKKRVADVIDRFFSDENDFSKTTLEDAGAALFKELADQVPELSQQQAAYILKDVRFTIEYDGSLDHPCQTIEFSRSVKEPVEPAL